MWSLISSSEQGSQGLFFSLCQVVMMFDGDCTFTGFLMSAGLLAGNDVACMFLCFSMSVAGLSCTSTSGGVHALPVSSVSSFVSAKCCFAGVKFCQAWWWNSAVQRLVGLILFYGRLKRAQAGSSSKQAQTH